MDDPIAARASSATLTSNGNIHIKLLPMMTAHTEFDVQTIRATR